MTSSSFPLWHLLQVSDVLDTEFASALAELVPVLAWEPRRSLLPSRIRPGQEEERLFYNNSWDQQEPALRVRQLPLLRGFARMPISLFARTGPAVLARLLAQTPDPARSPLICTAPFFAPVAELWPGPVIYWLADLIAEYPSQDRKTVIRLDRRLCRAATLVCPNSTRLRRYLIDHAACDPKKIQVLPNATRASNLLPQVPDHAAPLPSTASHPNRPVAGVIGNLAGNMDWVMLERLLELTPWLSWIFVGPVQMEIEDPVARRARDAVMVHERTDFVGRKPYGELASFARSFDVAILPYKLCEPTYSGSSTRFYEHLAACRPMIATPGLEELIRKVPLLSLVDNAEEAADSLDELRAKNFDDGLAEMRWNASRDGTWQVRARTVRHALAERWNAPAEAEALQGAIFASR